MEARNLKLRYQEGWFPWKALGKNPYLPFSFWEIQVFFDTWLHNFNICLLFIRPSPLGICVSYSDKGTYQWSQGVPGLILRSLT